MRQFYTAEKNKINYCRSPRRIYDAVHCKGVTAQVKNKTTRFLIISIICISILCVIVFSYLTLRMNRRGAKAIEELGAIYMTGMGEQAANHFGTTIELRLSQVGALVDSVPPVDGRDISSTKVQLSYNARARGFDHLAFLFSDGSFEMLYGSDIIADDAEPFLDSLTSGEGKMEAGRDSLGNSLVLMGIPAAYRTDDGRESIALVAALPVSYISDTLSLDPDNEMIYYFIIDREGEFYRQGQRRHGRVVLRASPQQV